jgi:hypothetical protein
MQPTVIWQNDRGDCYYWYETRRFQFKAYDRHHLSVPRTLPRVGAAFDWTREQATERATAAGYVQVYPLT